MKTLAILVSIVGIGFVSVTSAYAQSNTPTTARQAVDETPLASFGDWLDGNIKSGRSVGTTSNHTTEDLPPHNVGQPPFNTW